MNTLTIVWGFVFPFVFFAQVANASEDFRLAIVSLLLYILPTWHRFVVLDTNSDANISYIHWATSVVIVLASYRSEAWPRLWVSFALVALVYNATGFEQYNWMGGWRALLYDGVLLISIAIARYLEPEKDRVHVFYRILIALICGLGLAQSIVLCIRDEPDRWNDVPYWAFGVSIAAAAVNVLLNVRFHARNVKSLREFYGVKYTPVSS